MNIFETALLDALTQIVHPIRTRAQRRREEGSLVTTDCDDEDFVDDSEPPAEMSNESADESADESAEMSNESAEMSNESADESADESTDESADDEKDERNSMTDGAIDGLDSSAHVWQQVFEIPPRDEIVNLHVNLHAPDYAISAEMVRFLMATVQHVTTVGRMRFLGMTHLDGWQFTRGNWELRQRGQAALSNAQAEAIDDLRGRLQRLLSLAVADDLRDMLAGADPPPSDQTRAIIVRVLLPAYTNRSTMRNEAFVLIMLRNDSAYYFDPLANVAGNTRLGEQYSDVITTAIKACLPEDVNLHNVAEVHRCTPFGMYLSGATAIWCVWVAVCMSTEGMTLEGMSDFIDQRISHGSMSSQLQPFVMSMRCHMTAMLVILYNTSKHDDDDASDENSSSSVSSEPAQTR